jgi:hypothetical protein
VSNYTTDKTNIQNDITSIQTNKADISYVDTKVSDLIGGASGAYDTLKEIQTFLQSDANSISTILTHLDNKVSVDDYTAYQLLNDSNITDLQNNKANLSYVQSLNTTLTNNKLDKTLILQTNLEINIIYIIYIYNIIYCRY